MHIEQAADIKKTIGNISSSYLIRIARYPFLIIYIFIIPRMIGASDYGRLAFFISILMLSSEILTFGITPVLGRFLPEYIIKKETQKLERLLSSYFILELIIILILSFAGIISFIFIQISQQEFFYIVIIFFAVILEIYSSILFSILYGLNYVGKSNVTDLFRTVFRLVFLLVFYPIWGFTGALFSLILTPILSSIYAFYFIRKEIKFKYQKPILKEFLPKFKFGINIFAPTLFFLFQQQIGPVFLKIFSISNKEIGFFDLANQGFLVLFGLAATGFRALIPISSKFQITGQEGKSIKWLFMLFRYILPMLLIIVSGFYFFGYESIILILGKEYLHVYTITLIILISMPIWIIGQLGYVRSISLLNAKPYFFSRIYSTIIFIIFGVLLVTNLGATGLAFSILLSGITFSASMLLSYKEMILHISIILVKTFISFVSFLPILFLNSQSIGLKLIVFLSCLILFLIILFKLKIINKNELKQLLYVLQKKNIENASI